MSRVCAEVSTLFCEFCFCFTFGIPAPSFLPQRSSREGNYHPLPAEKKGRKVECSKRDSNAQIRKYLLITNIPARFIQHTTQFYLENIDSTCLHGTFCNYSTVLPLCYKRKLLSASRECRFFSSFSFSLVLSSRPSRKNYPVPPSAF